MRLLSTNEIEQVCGGDGEDIQDIVVTGRRQNDDFWSFNFLPMTYYGNAGGDFSFGDGAFGGAADPTPTDTHHSDQLTDKQKEHVHQAIDTAIGAIKDAVSKYGDNLKIELPNKTVISAAEAIEGLSKLNDAVSAGLLVDGLISGDKGLKDAAGFLAGLAAVALLPEEIPAVAAALVGIAADKLVEAGVEQLQVAHDAAIDTLNRAVEAGVQDGSIPSYDPTNPGGFFDDLFGIPHEPGRFSEYENYQ